MLEEESDLLSQTLVQSNFISMLMGVYADECEAI